MRDTSIGTLTAGMPSRFERPGRVAFILYVIGIAFFVLSIEGAEMSVSALITGLPNMGRMVADMLPPSPDRLVAVGWALLETFEMALVGTAIGVLLSLPFGIFATRGLTPSPALYHLSRAVIAMSRTVPDLVWALFFVVAVGLGPFAGTLALVMDTLGFCGRFFAEAMEEADSGPREALTALGATRSGTIFSAVIPAALPSFVNTSLFALEKATRSSVVLGLVGAGGIGIELKVSMDMFEYDEAATIILAIFALVVVVERASAAFRRRII
jgi:phosphonate transport system permease protein